jgi:hypothetical protein
MADRYMNANFADPETPQDMRQACGMIQLLTPLLQNNCHEKLTTFLLVALLVTIDGMQHGEEIHGTAR